MTTAVEFAREILNMTTQEDHVEFRDKHGNTYFLDCFEWDNWDDESKENETLVIKLRRMGE